MIELKIRISEHIFVPMGAKGLCGFTIYVKVVSKLMRKELHKNKAPLAIYWHI